MGFTAVRRTLGCESDVFLRSFPPSAGPFGAARSAIRPLFAVNSAKSAQIYRIFTVEVAPRFLGVSGCDLDRKNAALLQG